MEVYGDFTEELDEEGDSTNLLAITITNTHSKLITSSRFPSSGRTATIPLTIDSTDDETDNDDMTAKLRGSFDGASGTFQCSGGPCTVRNTGGGYVLTGGTWTFRTSKSSTVTSPTWSSCTLVGGVKRRITQGGAFTYGTFQRRRRKRNLVAGSGFTSLEGSATYEGPAIGQYAIYQPLGTQSNHGAFKATARFTANFDHGDALRERLRVRRVIRLVPDVTGNLHGRRNGVRRRCLLDHRWEHHRTAEPGTG